MRVGPSNNREAWERFFHHSTEWKAEEFHALIDNDEPGAAAFEIATFINGAYRALEMGMGRPDTQFRCEWVAANARRLYLRSGLDARNMNLGIMRWIKHASCLGVVLGAGVTMASGGPSWPNLVSRLLTIALNDGHELARMVETSDSTPQNQRFEREVYDVKRFDKKQASEARQVVEKVSRQEASVDELMKGAQLCLQLFGQHLYTHLTGILYEQERGPSDIHRAIAELATPQFVPDRGGEYPGWSDIVSYNFDDFMGMALDELGLARAAYAMRGDELAGDPNEAAVKLGPQGLHQGIFHLHGYTPKKLFNITHVRYVFATSEYKTAYDGDALPVFTAVNQRLLQRPVFVAMYVGCSFSDDAMNNLLMEASQQLPGRMHYALMKWPGAGPLADANEDELAEHDAELRWMGVRPVWFEDFREIPDLIRILDGPPGEAFAYQSAYT